MLLLHINTGGLLPSLKQAKLPSQQDRRVYERVGDTPALQRERKRGRRKERSSLEVRELAVHEYLSQEISQSFLGKPNALGKCLQPPPRLQVTVAATECLAVALSGAGKQSLISCQRDER